MIPLLLIPGFLCDVEGWRHQIENLKDVAVPYVGDTLKDDSLPSMVERILHDAPPRFALAGFSMGGYISQYIALHAPERVIKLALLSTSPYADTPKKKQERYNLITLLQEGGRGRFTALTENALEAVLHPDRMQDDLLISSLIAMSRRLGQEVYVRQTLACVEREDLSQRLRHLTMPTLLLHGRQDTLLPLKCSQDMVSLIPRSHLCIVEECGHQMPMECPQATTALLRHWLINGEKGKTL